MNNNQGNYKKIIRAAQVFFLTLIDTNNCFIIKRLPERKFWGKMSFMADISMKFR